jgi:CheY-like chemotaxis protein
MEVFLVGKGRKASFGGMAGTNGRLATLVLLGRAIMSSADPGLQRLRTVHAQTVLIIEDEIFVRCAVADHLRNCGMHVIEAANPMEAIRVLGSGTEIDLLFSDVQMPGFIDGVALARWIAVEHPSVKIILTSGPAERSWGSPHDNIVLPKPYDHHDLEAKIRQLLGERGASHFPAATPCPGTEATPMG